MATFNGASYLQEQLDSLAAQKFLPHELVLCDDGSTDATLAIAEKFAALAPFPVRITRNAVRLGHADNFLNAASSCQGEWIAFCDQDDSWLPNRLAAAAAAIGAEDDDLMMVVQAAELSDHALNPSGRRLPEIAHRHVRPRNAHYGFWVRPGFSLTIRGSLVRALPWHERPLNYLPCQLPQSHDKWVCMLANALGNVAYLPESAAFFRRHDAALTGSYDGRGFGQSINLAVRTGGAHYQYLSKVAMQSAACLRSLSVATVDAEWAARLEEGAALFDRLESVHRGRASIYLSRGLLSRLSRLGSVFREGGYFGHPFVRMPAGALLKDVAMCFALAWVSIASERVSAD